MKASKKNESDKSTANLHGEKARMASQDKPSEGSSTKATVSRITRDMLRAGLWLIIVTTATISDLRKG